jgi:vacuolar protein sorting-associated protein 45
MTTIDQIPDEKLTHLKAIFFCRLTEKNVKLICQEISGNPKFSQYCMYFTNKVDTEKLTKIAESDVHNVVTQLQEVYLDYQAVNPHLFTLDMPSCISLQKPRREWSLIDELSFERMSAGLISVLLSVRG